MSKKYSISFNVETDSDAEYVQDAIWSLLQTGTVSEWQMFSTSHDIELPNVDNIVIKEVDDKHLPFRLYASRTSDHPIVEADGSDAQPVRAEKTLSRLYPDIYYFRDNGYNVTVRYEPYGEKVWTVVYDWYRLRSLPWINNSFFCDHDHQDLL